MVPLRRRRTAIAGAAALLGALGAPKGRTRAQERAAPPNIEGIVWQPDTATVEPRGDWNKLGVRRLLVQWTVVDGLAFVPGTDFRLVPKLPDWARIAQEPWAQEVILGLAGRYDERVARTEVPQLADISSRLARLPTPLKVVGWYFPVEVDPTWTEAPRLADALRSLPRPLWISVYDSANVGAETLADWLTGWLPSNLNVFFQDGVGVHAREASVAGRYADVLADRLGKNRLCIIAEAFRPQIGGGFRAATLDELRLQLAAYGEHPIFLFEGPHYVGDELVRGLLGQRPGQR